ncbi:carboxypeptidase-like regulatory domain-containing protein [Phaeacidiphilus oryzae]|uniref:carboxypeptidase-like regulatory domain-containing protein n=1 Tax=Phaeacidiphilus oryzae TaxID=348818 RepID=UPI000ADEEBA2|nr:carboxypeptidase-like regulatory domain-containing protein [Phaeacidiphilus oryzae]
MTAIDQTGRQLALARSGADGRYAVRPFAAGALGADGADALVLIASAPGHQPEATTVPLRPGAGPAAVDLLLGGSTGIHGTVLGSGGLPVAGALVVVTDQAGEVVASGLTSAEGGYGFERLAPGGYTLAFTAEGHQPVAVPVDAGAGGPVRQDLTLPQAAAIRGVVRDPAGRPLAHAKVSLLDAGGSVVRNHLTGEDGAYAFDGLAGSEFTLVATGYPPASTAVSLQGGGRDGVDLALAHGAD